jgi:hypothetical protein
VAVEYGSTAAEGTPAGGNESSGIETHLTVVAALHIAVSALALVVFAFAFFVILGTGVWMAEVEGMALGTAIGAFVLFVFGALALPGLIGGLGLLGRRGWAGPLLLIVSFFHLINFPIGTALGGYTIWVLLQPEARNALGRPRGP